MKKIISFLLSIVFFLFASLQFNDPDPLIWVAVYALTSILCLFFGFGKSFPTATLSLLFLCLLWCVTLVPSLFQWIQSSNVHEIFGSMMGNKPYIEESREFMGLLIASAGLFLIWKFGKSSE
ncbi:MAG: transmembrane 220 family protein [Chitinophagaceae bacterium]|nr:transmembrane 220 family protein [Chitinophagaceae bacterium]